MRGRAFAPLDGFGDGLFGARVGLDVFALGPATTAATTTTAARRHVCAVVVSLAYDDFPFDHDPRRMAESDTLATAHYGEPLSAIVRRRNFWGTQFHPERSAATGARLLANFLRLG